MTDGGIPVSCTVLDQQAVFFVPGASNSKLHREAFLMNIHFSASAVLTQLERTNGQIIKHY